MPWTSVLSPTLPPSLAPECVARADVAPARGTVDRPRGGLLVRNRDVAAAPARASACIRPETSSAVQRSGTYTAWSPRARNAAFCMSGRKRVRDRISEDAQRRVCAPRSPHRAGHPAHHAVIMLLELGVGRRDSWRDRSRRDRSPRRVPFPPGVLAQHVHLVLAAQLGHAGAVMARHRQDQIGRLDQLAGEQLGPVAARSSPCSRPTR